MRVPRRVLRAAGALVPVSCEGAASEGEVAFWRCANERAQAQAVAADVERLVATEGVAPGQIAVLVPSVSREGAAVAVALEERAVPHRLVGESAFFRRAEIRDVLAWLRLLADPTDAPAVVRALARPPIELRSVDIARCTQIARRRKLDMVAALEAAIEAPQVPPEARERIHGFLKLYRAGMSGIDSTRSRPVCAPADRRARAAPPAAVRRPAQRRRAAPGPCALRRSRRRLRPPGSHATPREFARHIAAVADFGLREHEEPDLLGPQVVQVVALDRAGALEAEHVYVLGLHAGLSEPAPDPALRLPPIPRMRRSRPVRRSALRRGHAGAPAGRADVPGVGDRGSALLAGADGRDHAPRGRRYLGGPRGGDVRAGRDAPFHLPVAAG